MQAVRSLLFFIGQLSATLVYWPVTVLAYPLPPLSRSRVIGGWARFVLWWLRVTCNLRHEVEGREERHLLHRLREAERDDDADEPGQRLAFFWEDAGDT